MMRKSPKVLLFPIALVVIVFLASAAMGQSAPPRIFFSDLTAGPVSGGQNGAGAFVTLYGNGFGNTRGSSTVTIGGKKAVSYPIWSNTKVTFQLGSTASSGNIVINLADVVSNSIPFSVTTGRIYFVSPSGKDTNSGSYVSPWRSLGAAKNRIAAGDIVYVENGVAVTNVESDGASLVLNSGGIVVAPKAIIAYPGSTVTIGSSVGAKTGIRVTSGNWVLSGLTLRGTQSGITLSEASGSRVTSSDISCPRGHGSGSCVSVKESTEFAFLGNYVHDNGDASSINVGSYHSVAFTSSHSVEVGWNEIANARGCNALMFRANTSATHSVLVHDNYIHDARCEAISLGAVDPSLGAVSLYNNVISKSGTGPEVEGAEADKGYAAISVAGGASTPVRAYNNTIYQAGAMGGGEAGAVRVRGALELTNNIVYLAGGEQYISMDSDLGWVTGSKNAFYGAGNPPAVFADSVVANPELVSPNTGDFHLLAGSPAINAGALTGLVTDVSGVLTPQNSGITIGAFEWVPRSSFRGTLVATPASLAFGNISAGQSVSATTVISNSGIATISVSQANSNNAQFKVSGVTFPLTISPGQSAVLTVTFTPSAAGTQSGTVSVTSNAMNSPLNITVGGVGLAAPTANLSPTSLTFASQIVSTTSAAQIATLSNTGNASLAISSIVATGDFSIQSGCGASLAVNTSCSLSVAFNPTATGTRSGTLTVSDNAASQTQQITLSGTGAAGQAATLQANPSSISMGSVTVGGSATQSVKITNTGATTATISTITSSSGVFFVSGATLPAAVAAGGSVTLTVTFTPTGATSYGGTLMIQSNATNPTLWISLAGTGSTAAVSHSASLAWSESSASAVGYNAYRSTQSGTGYAKMNGSSIGTTSYTDNTVSAGLTYYYVVTAVDANGNESAYSSQISATIPTP